MSHLVDRYLLFRIRIKRDPEAFGQIYDRYVAAVYRFALLKLPSKEEAQDIVSETFLRAWTYIQEHDDIRNVRALLYRIARNLIVDYYRSRHETVSVERVTFEEDFTSVSLQAFTDAGRGRDLIEAKAEAKLVLERVNQLKDDYRDVLMLRLVDDLSFEEIGSLLEKKTGHVRVIYHRALKALKTIPLES
jgi:RNA polymerase sigma-70 factor (ECF subfamily)